MQLGSLFICSILLLLLLCCSAAKKLHNNQCDKPPSCGQIRNISYPFALKLGDHTNYCGNNKPVYLLECDENNNTIYYSNQNQIKHYVLAINYHNSTIRIVDAALQPNNCSSLPLRSFTNHHDFEGFYYTYECATVLYLSCENPVDSNSLYIDTRPCIHGHSNKSYNYVMLGYSNVSEIADSCRIDMVVKSSSPTIYTTTANLSYAHIHNELLYGFELEYEDPWPHDSFCFLCIVANIGAFITMSLPYYVAELIPFMVCAKLLFGTPFVAAFLIYKWRRRHLSMFDMVEDFLHSQNNLIPIKYSFSEIKKMTNGFKHKLGEGGYGSVYKGKLRSGRKVAVKILGKSKCNGQEFINEVATIGRIHHANVVQLIGFCAERSKRALVYEFMPNGSLEKYIFQEQGNASSISCQKMYEISIGVARGIEYLHRGCHMQILHFDIKPHNILLDENFNPKVSDFGLAKLYPIEDSIVSLTAARGTMGYMAPELFYKNIGGISYKADVYSFGMLLMEMGSKRKNLNLFVEHSSQIYFPCWVFEELSLGKEIEIGETTEEEKEIVKRMLMVSLWCIQMKPGDRPSMNKVVEMLENEDQELPMPPKPFLSLQRQGEHITKSPSSSP